MKKLKAILSISLVGILMFSTVGFSVHRHYCMGMLMDESFYTMTESCGDEADNHCETPSNHIKSGCCDDENLVFSGIDVISIVKKQLDVGPVIAALIPSVSNSVEPQSTDYKLLSFFPPPEPQPYGKNLLVKVQRFLI